MAAVARVMGCPLGRDTLAVTVYASSEAGVGARGASDDAFEEILAGRRWQDAVDIPGGAQAAAAGVPPGTRHDLKELETGGTEEKDGDKQTTTTNDSDRSDGSDDDEDGGEGGRGGGGGGRGVGGDGSGVGPASPWPWSWRPLVTHATVPRLPKGARVEVQPLALDGDGPGAAGGGGGGGGGGGVAEGEGWWDGDVEESRDAVEERVHDVGGGGGKEGYCRSLSRAGRFCRAHAAVARVGGPADGAAAAAAAAVGAVGAALDAAGLSWEQVGILRAYVPSPSSSSSSSTSSGGSRWLKEAAEALDAALGEAALGRASAGAGVGGEIGGTHSSSSSLRCVVVPVLGASFGDIDDAALVLELTAVAG